VVLSALLLAVSAPLPGEYRENLGRSRVACLAGVGVASAARTPDAGLLLRLGERRRRSAAAGSLLLLNTFRRRVRPVVPFLVSARVVWRLLFHRRARRTPHLA